MDSAATFEMIFGSEKFEPLVGELQLAAMANSQEDAPPELMDFKQRKREVMIASNLAKTLEPFIEGELEDFNKTQEEMCQELSANPMGKMMLGVISYIYVE